MSQLGHSSTYPQSRQRTKDEKLKEKCHELLMNTQKEQAKGLYISLDYHPLDFI